MLTKTNLSFSANHKEHIPVFLAADNNYAPFVATTMASILKNTKSFIDFYVLSNNISPKYKQKIENEKKYFHNFSVKFIDVNEKLKDFKDTKLSKTAYARLFIPDFDITKNLKKIIYLDVDIIALRDISTLYNQNLDNYVAGVVSDVFLNYNGKTYSIFSSKRNYSKKLLNFLTKNGANNIKHYFNAGMLLIDLEKWRKEKISENVKKIIPLVNGNYDLQEDQTILNIALVDKIKILDTKYNESMHRLIALNNNLMIMKEYIKYILNNSVIIHYTCPKPWDNSENNYFLNQEFWKIVKYTDFEEEINMYEMANKIKNHFTDTKKKKNRKRNKIIIISVIILIFINIILSYLIAKCVIKLNNKKLK